MPNFGGKVDHSFFHYVWLHNVKLGHELESKVKTQSWSISCASGIWFGSQLEKKGPMLDFQHYKVDQSWSASWATIKHPNVLSKA